MGSKVAFLLFCVAFLTVAEGFVVRVKPFGPNPASGVIYSTDGFLRCGFEGVDVCTVELGAGQSVTLLAAARAGSRLATADTWKFRVPGTATAPTVTGKSDCNNNQRSCTFTVDKDIDIIVTFQNGLSTDGTAEGGARVTAVEGFLDQANQVSANQIDSTSPILPVSTSADPTFSWTLNKARTLLSVTWACSDQKERKPSTPISAIPRTTFGPFRPTPAFPPFAFCVVTATFDNKDRGSEPQSFKHEYGFEVREQSNLPAIDVFSESDLSTEGVVTIQSADIFWKALPFTLAPGELLKGKLSPEDVEPDSFPYIADAEISIKGGAGGGTVICNIGFILPSSSTIHLSGNSNRAQIVLDPGDERTYLNRREFDVYRGNTAPWVAFICKNLGEVEALDFDAKKRKRSTEQQDTRVVNVGPLVYNFIPRVALTSDTLPPVENKFVHRFEFANTMRVRPDA